MGVEKQMKEQIQVPFDTNSASDREREEGKAKNLGRPSIANSLQRPVAKRVHLYRHCSCGGRGCQAPASCNEGDGYFWMYRDRETDEIVYDPSFPRVGRGEYRYKGETFS